MFKDKPFNIIRAEYPELLEWLKSISRYCKIENFIIPDYKGTKGVRINFYTKDHRYHIVAINPISDNKDSYLGCTAQTRKPRAGEDWNRGSDLADGSYSKETWQRIVNDILSYELVKVVKTPKEFNK